MSLPYEDPSFRREFGEEMRRLTVEQMTAALAGDPEWREVCAKAGITSADDMVPSALEIASIGAEPFCSHGLSPLMSCRECLSRALTEASVQVVYRKLTGHELADEDAAEIVDGTRR